MEFVHKVASVDGKVFRLQIWDTAGAERFHAVVPSYYRKADAALLVFDVSSRASFDRVQASRRRHTTARTYSMQVTDTVCRYYAA